MNRLSHQVPRKQQGISLIELMVTMVLSGFLVIGITQLYVDNQRTYMFQQSQAGNQENARFAGFIFNEYLGRAGYRRSPDQAMEDAFPAVASNDDCEAFDVGGSVTAAVDGVGVCIRYQPLTATELDCQGNQVTAFDDDKGIFEPPPVTSLVTLAIRYQPADGGELNEGVLQCKSINSAAAAYVELLQGVADFRLEFGLGDQGENDKTLKDETDPNRFKLAEEWVPNNGPIRAVRYSILMASRDSQRDSDDSAVLDNWLKYASNDVRARLEGGDNRRIYQIASNTQNLRNLMP